MDYELAYEGMQSAWGKYQATLQAEEAAMALDRIQRRLEAQYNSYINRFSPAYRSCSDWYLGEEMPAGLAALFVFYALDHVLEEQARPD